MYMTAVSKWFRRPTVSQAVALVIASTAFTSIVISAVVSGDVYGLIKSIAVPIAAMWTIWHVVSYLVDSDLV